MGPTNLLPPSVTDTAWTRVTTALSSSCRPPTTTPSAPLFSAWSDFVPAKFLAVTSAAALAYYVDQKLLLSSDVRHSRALVLALLQAKRYARDNTLVVDLFEQSAAKWPHKSCLQCGARVLTFEQADEAMNRVAQWGLARHLQVGQTVALLMENRLEFILVWLGLAKIGVVTALLNTNLPPAGLVHCATIADARYMIVGQELARHLPHVAAQLPHMIYYIYGNGNVRHCNERLTSWLRWSTGYCFCYCCCCCCI